MLVSLPGGAVTGLLSARAFYDSLGGVSLSSENGSALAPSRDEDNWLLAASSSPLLDDSTSELDLSVAPMEGGASVAMAEQDDPRTLSNNSSGSLLDADIPLSDWDTDPFPLLLADAQFAMATAGGDTSSSSPQVSNSSFDSTGSAASPGTASSSNLATDSGSSYPSTNLTDSSLNVAPDTGAATVDSADSSTNAVAAGTANSLQVTDGSPITLGDFPADLAGWTVEESGGSDIGGGAVTVITGDAVMQEGDSFLVTLDHTFEIPQDASALSFTYADLNLDATDPDSINDAFEAALVDGDGNPLVHTIEAGRDAFFNISEDQPADVGDGTTVEDERVTVDLSGVLPGTAATLIFRLVNNDSDTGSSVRILGGGTPGDDDPPVVTVELENDTAPEGPDNVPYLTDLLTNDATVLGTAIDDLGISQLHARVDDGAWADITGTLTNGSFGYDPGTLPPGPHTITVRATDTAGQPGEALVEFTVNSPPVANAGGNRTVPEATTVSFDASGSTDTEASIYAYQWTFDDGTTTDGIAPSHHYPQDGVYSVALMVTDTAGSTHTDSIEVTVLDLAPAAAFNWYPEPQDEGFLVEFTDESTGYPDAIVSWNWDFGGLDTSTEQNPSFTFADDGAYTVTLTVTDDDGSTAIVSHTVTVLDLMPTAGFAWSPEPQDEGSPVQFTDESTSYPDTIVAWDWDFDGSGASTDQNPSFTFMDDGTYTVTLTVTDEDGSIDTISHTVNVSDLSPTAGFSWTPEPQDEGSAIQFTDASTSAPDDIVGWSWDFAGLGTSAAQNPSFAFLDDGSYTVTLTVTDEDGSTSTVSHVVTIDNVAPSVTASPAGQSVQYSDPIAPITITATDVPADTLTTITFWSKNEGLMTPGLPNGLTLSGSGSAGSGSWTISGIADVEPADYLLRFATFDEDGGATITFVVIRVLQEDAAITYSGVPFVSTQSINHSEATVVLRAIIQDVTAVDPAADPAPGDIRYATVTFVHRETGNIIASGLPVSLLDTADTKTGIVSHEWTVDLGNADSESYTIGIIVDGYYMADSADDDTVITVSKPLDNFITGGGFLINQESAGQYAGDPGLRTNYGFNVKFNKKLTNLQGHVNVIVRQEGHVYQIKSNATTSLVVDRYTNHAVFTAKANLKEVTDPANAISLGGGHLLEMTITDRGEPGFFDSIGITLWTKDSDLLYSSRLVGLTTAEQTIDGGNLVIHKERGFEEATKFFVVDSGTDGVLRYTDAGTENGGFSLDSLVTEPRGATSNAVGDTVWVIDAATQKVFVSSPSGLIRGAWVADGLTDPQGIATDGTDIWIVDAAAGSVLQYAGAAALTAGIALVGASFALHPNNTSPTGLATDGSTLWVADDGMDEVFVYNPSGTLLGRWGLAAENTDASGITNDPTGGTSLWVVDRADLLVYHYDTGTTLTSGGAADVDTFPLAAGNLQPEGIADPLPGTTSVVIEGVEQEGQTLLAASVVEYSESDSYEHLGTMIGQNWTDPVIPGLHASGTYISAGRGRHADPPQSGRFGAIRSVLAFDLTGIPDGSTLDSLSLQMTIVGYEDSGSTPPVVALHEISGSATMVDGEVTWANARTGVPWSAPGGDYLSTVLSSGSADASPSPGEVVTFSSTLSFVSAAQRALDAGSPLELILLSQGAEDDTGSQQRWTHFASDDHSNPSWRPKLTVEYESPPHIVVISPDDSSSFSPGSKVLVAGESLAVAPNATITNVVVNGAPVDVLDASGGFFTQVDVIPGQNVFEFTTTDTYGQTAGTTLTLMGVQPTPGEIDFSLFSDVTASLEGAYARTSFNENSDILYADMAVRNAGQYSADAPLLVGLTNLSDPTVRVRDPDGLTPEGIPYYNYSDLVAGGTLQPGELTGDRTLAFYNPNRIQFTYDLVFLGQLNQAPQFLTVPDVEALAGRAYRYDSDATDPDADPVSFSKVAGPQNASVDPTTGEITWSPTADDLGNHAVVLRAEDGRGGSTEQHYVLSVIEPPPNRPPYFTSIPVVDAIVNQPYVYDANADDPDGDTLAYERLVGSGGMTIDPITGVLGWTPSSNQVGTHNVTLEVSDGLGGSATQPYVIRVAPDPDNHPPLIVSEPVTTAPSNGTYTYDVDAIDPDDDVVEYALTDGPEGMTIATDTGLIIWDVPNLDAPPEFEFAFSLGSSGSDYGQAIATDAEGNIYLTAFFTGTVDFDPGPGVFNLTALGLTDVFVGKYSPAGELLWGRSTGGNATSGGHQGNMTDASWDIALDDEGNVYIIGEFLGTADFDPGPEVFNLTSAGGLDAFVWKLDNDGNFIWAGRFGGSGNDSARGVALDELGNVHTIGTFSGTADFDPGVDTYNLSAGAQAVFVSKLDSDGTFGWARRILGGETSTSSIGVDGGGNVYVAGYFRSTADFDPDGNGYVLTTAGQTDAFVAKFDSAGSFNWAHSMGGVGYDRAYGLTVDPSGNVYATGIFSDVVDFDPGLPVYALTSVGGYDAFVVRLDSAGNFVWANGWGGDGSDSGNSLALDRFGNLYVGGVFTGTVDFDPGLGTFDLTSGNFGYLSKLDSEGKFVWATRVMGLVAMNSAGDIYGTGAFQGRRDFDPGDGTFELTSSGGSYDVFVTKLTQAPSAAYVAVRADDDRGGFDEQSFVVELAENQPPEIVSDPVITASRGKEYSYDVDAIDPDDDPLTYSLVEAPEGMTVDATSGIITWPNAASGPEFDVPGFEFGFAIGSTGDDYGFKVVADAVGNMYVTGAFHGTVDFNPGPGVTNLTAAGLSDVFVAKYGPAGEFIWARNTGGSGTTGLLQANLTDLGWGIALDAFGNVYVTGMFEGTADFDPGPETFSLSSAGDTDAFLWKLDNDGNFVWAVRMGGSGRDQASGLVLDRSGNLYVNGYFEQTVDFDPGPGSFPLTSAGQTAVFVAKLDTDGNFVWARDFDGANGNVAHGAQAKIAVDEVGNTYTVGHFYGTIDFDPGTETSFLTSAGYNDGFVVKLDPAGRLDWARQMGGDRWDIGAAVGVDENGNVYTTGWFYGTADFDPGPAPFHLTSAGGYDAFLSKLDSDGNFVWAKRWGGSGQDFGHAIAVDRGGTVYVAGSYSGSVDLDPGPDTYILPDTSPGTSPFLSNFDGAGNFLWARNAPNGPHITLDDLDSIYMTGNFEGLLDLDPGPEAYGVRSQGGYDTFVYKLSQGPRSPFASTTTVAGTIRRAL